MDKKNEPSMSGARADRLCSGGDSAQPRAPFRVGVALMAIGATAGLFGYGVTARDHVFRNPPTAEIAADSIVAEGYARMAGSLAALELRGELGSEGAEMKVLIDGRYAEITAPHSATSIVNRHLDQAYRLGLEAPLNEPSVLAYSIDLMRADHQIRDLVRQDIDMRISAGASIQDAHRAVTELAIRAGARAHLEDLDGDILHAGEPAYDEIRRAGASVTISAMRAIVNDKVTG